MTFPVSKKLNKTVICLPYDIDNIYAFYCARYKDISFDEFMNLRVSDFVKKLGSIPESEPLYTIIKSRTIELSKIKDKEERKYWRELKRINKIPDIYLSNIELDQRLKEGLSNAKFFGKRS